MLIKPTVAEIAYRTAYHALTNDPLDSDTVKCSYEHKENGHVINRTRYNRYVKFLNFGCLGV